MHPLKDSSSVQQLVRRKQVRVPHSSQGDLPAREFNPTVSPVNAYVLLNKELRRNRATSALPCILRREKKRLIHHLYLKTAAIQV